VSNNELQQVKDLIKGDTDVNFKGTGGTTALHVAAYFNSELDIVKVLLQEKAEVNIKDDNDWTPLHYAVANNSYDIISVLIEKGADVNVTGACAKSLLNLAFSSKSYKSALALIDAGAVIDQTCHIEHKGQQRSCHSLEAAIRTEQLGIVNYIIYKQPNLINKTLGGCKPLQVAIDTGNLDIVKALIAAGANVNTACGLGYSLLRWAVVTGSLEMLEVLIAAGANVNPKLTYASSETPMQRAVIKGSLEMVKALIAAGADVNAKGEYGRTPLYWAVSYNHYAIALVLIIAKAKGFLAKNKTAIVTFLSLVVVGLLAAHFVPQVFLFLTGPLLGSLGLIHNLPVLQVTVLSLISLPLVSYVVNSSYGKIDSVKVVEERLRADGIKPDTAINPTSGSSTNLKPIVLEEGNGNGAQASVDTPPAHK
jgi:ankyrin repeat protein